MLWNQALPQVGVPTPTGRADLPPAPPGVQWVRANGWDSRCAPRNPDGAPATRPLRIDGADDDDGDDDDDDDDDACLFSYLLAACPLGKGTPRAASDPTPGAALARAYTDSFVPRCTCAPARQCFWCTCERERANYQTTVLRLGFWSGTEVVVP